LYWAQILGKGLALVLVVTVAVEEFGAQDALKNLA